MLNWFLELLGRGSVDPASFAERWRPVIASRVPHWQHLNDEYKDRLDVVAAELVAHKRWEAANGFELDDEMVITIAAQAALLAIGLPDGVYRKVRTIVVHPSTLVLTGEHSFVSGIASRDPQAVLGLAHGGDTVVVAWDAVLNDARHPGTGHNVVVHEFAHVLDLLDGTADGTPPVATAEQFDRWVRVCTEAYQQVADGHGGSSLRSYAGVNPSEFFAVATEAFFDNPVSLRNEHNDLYDVLMSFYQQDPATRVGAIPSR